MRTLFLIVLLLFLALAALLSFALEARSGAVSSGQTAAFFGQLAPSPSQLAVVAVVVGQLGATAGLDVWRLAAQRRARRYEAAKRRVAARRRRPSFHITIMQPLADPRAVPMI